MGLCRRQFTKEFKLAAIQRLEMATSVTEVALGIDVGGVKHVLGLWQGATENAAVVKALLEDLVRRGVKLDETPSSDLLPDRYGCVMTGTGQHA